MNTLPESWRIQLYTNETLPVPEAAPPTRRDEGVAPNIVERTGEIGRECENQRARFQYDH